ncbi:MAG: Kelch repeat-containing protein [Acidobacteriota bacterium]
MAALSPLCRGQAPGTWETLAPMPSMRQEVGVGILAGKVYVVGGFDQTVQSVNTVERYDPTTDAWESVAPLPEPLNHVGVATLQNRLFVIGGFRQDFSPVSSVFAYDPRNGQWTQKASLPEARGAMGVATVNGRIYAAGGSPAQLGTRLTVYDPGTDTWTALPEMPTNRNHLAAAGLGGKLYAFSGRVAGLLQEATEVFDPATGQWSPRAPVPTPRGGIAAAVVGGRAYVFGGEGNPEDPDGIFNEVNEYDPLTDSWQRMADMPEGRHGIGAASHQGRILIPGGGPKEGASTTNRNDAFSPPGVTVVSFDGTPFLAPLEGEFGGIDWGAFGWFTFGGQLGPCSGPLALSLLATASFSFLQPAVLDSLEAGAPGLAGTMTLVTLASSGGVLEIFQAPVGAGLCTTLQTGFVQPAARVLVLFDQGRFTVDGVTYR